MNIKSKASKKGMAVAMVVFFAFAVLIGFLVITHSNMDIAAQNKKTLHEMQAYYLMQSAVQHAQLHIRLLPIETYRYFDKDGDPSEALRHIDSSNYQPLCIQTKKFEYDLFKSNDTDNFDFPYNGRYWVESFEHVGAHKGMKLAQDAYRITVQAQVWHEGRSSFDKCRASKRFQDELTDELTVSRSLGGISDK